ncbi:MAG TPA: response regulator, partial [Thermoanaerobaculia bacterium]|nr:response regulator [Thermoanaerobaculia bacterium]
TVQDTGRGVAPQFLPHVFEAFRQEDSSTTRAEGGIGLGLAIVKTVVELHGGRITARSEGVGHGSAFIVELPVLESPATFEQIVGEVRETVPSQRVSVEPRSLQGMSVLVIDDQEYTRDVIVAVLRRSGAAVHAAASVREGLEVFHSIRPDAVVCDIAMPEQDGYVFLRAVRAEGGAPSRTPVIALTAFGRPEDRQNALNAGFDAYLRKPVEPVDLAETILQVQSARRESRTD